MKKLATIFSLVLMLALTGCKTGKTSASGQSGKPDEVVILEKEIIEKENHGKETPGGVTPGQVVYANLDTRYAMLTGSWKAWRDVELGAKIRLLSPAKFNAAGKVYMKRGEWISVSVRMLGFEVATLWLDRDSVVAVDKFHKKYVSEPTASILGKAGLTIADVQDLLMGRAFIAGKGVATVGERKLFDLEDANNGWYMLPRRQPADYTYGFLASSTYNGLRGAVCEINGIGAITVDYSDIYESRLAGWFARKVTVEKSGKKQLAASLEWDLNGARFNAGLTRSCRIPDDCEKIPASKLASLLKNF